MSRIGKQPVTVPAGVDVKINGEEIVIKGKLGELTQSVGPTIDIKVEDNLITLSNTDESKDSRSKHGLYRSLINNMVIGVSEGFKIELELVGVGYRATNQGQVLDLSLGHSHHIYFQIPSEVKVETESIKGKAPVVILTSADKQLVGQVAAKIRSMRKPEPYKGKGVRFKGEEIRRKAGKTAAS